MKNFPKPICERQKKKTKRSNKRNNKSFINSLQLTMPLYSLYLHYNFSMIHLQFLSYTAHYLLRSFKNWHKKALAQFFLVRLLAFLLEGWPCFCLVASIALLVGLIGFILGLAISSAVLKGENIAISLARLSRW